MIMIFCREINESFEPVLLGYCCMGVGGKEFFNSKTDNNDWIENPREFHEKISCAIYG